jgi:hypothetical protein
MADIPAKQAPVPPRVTDRTGQRFGRLIVENLSHINKHAFWNCLCDCGNRTAVRGRNLTVGSTKSCGCRYAESVKELRFDLTGQRFNKFLVVRRHGSNSNHSTIWECLCDCGKTSLVSSYRLRKGRIKSCGCCCAKHIPFNNIFNKLRGCAKERGLECSLTLEQYLTFVGKNCYYCDEKLDWIEKVVRNEGTRKGPRGYNLDRKDNSLGYTFENCVPCCRVCNRTKSNHISHGLMLVIGQVIRHAGGWDAIKSGNSDVRALAGIASFLKDWKFSARKRKSKTEVDHPELAFY